MMKLVVVAEIVNDVPSVHRTLAPPTHLITPLMLKNKILILHYVCTKTYIQWDLIEMV